MDWGVWVLELRLGQAQEWNRDCGGCFLDLLTFSRCSQIETDLNNYIEIILKIPQESNKVLRELGQRRAWLITLCGGGGGAHRWLVHGLLVKGQALYKTTVSYSQPPCRRRYCFMWMNVCLRKTGCVHSIAQWWFGRKSVQPWNVRCDLPLGDSFGCDLGWVISSQVPHHDNRIGFPVWPRGSPTSEPREELTKTSSGKPLDLKGKEDLALQEESLPSKEESSWDRMLALPPPPARL